MSGSYLADKYEKVKIRKNYWGITEFFRHDAVWVHRMLLVVDVHNLNAFFEKKMMFFINNGWIRH